MLQCERLLNLQSISRKRHAVPLLVLAPDGLALNIDDLDYFRRPWNEVRDVTAIDLTTRATVYVLPSERIGGGASEIVGNYKGVTAVVVSRDFYDKAILPVRASTGRSRDLAGILKLRNGMIDHIRARHSILPVSRADLCTAVEARWHAFGGTTAVSGASVPR
jgi:hypothetical protein